MSTPTVWQTLTETWDFRVFLKYQCLGKLKLRHTGTYLGYFWWLLDPLLFLGIYYTVFGLILRRGGPNFLLFLFCALLPWRWFMTSISESTVSIRTHAGLLKQVYYPKVIAPLTSIFTNTVHFLFGLIILAAMLLIFRAPLGVNLLFFPVVVLCQLLFATGLGLVLSHAMVHFRDTAELLRYALQMWFYLSPGIYPASLIPEPYRAFYNLNPFAVLFTAYRDVLMYDRSPDFAALGVVALAALVLIVLGIKLIARYQGNYAKVL